MKTAAKAADVSVELCDVTSEVQRESMQVRVIGDLLEHVVGDEILWNTTEEYDFAVRVLCDALVGHTQELEKHAAEAASLSKRIKGGKNPSAAPAAG